MKRLLLMLVMVGCTDKPDLPKCADLGCDGTQSVPLYCPKEGDKGYDESPADGACFCAAPSLPDSWCWPE